MNNQANATNTYSDVETTVDNCNPNNQPNSTNTSYSDSDSITDNRDPTRVTTATQVTPNCNKRSRSENEEDLLLDLLDDTKPENSSLTLQPFPFQGMEALLHSDYQPNGIDPRGPNPKSRIPHNRHTVYCDSCECEIHLCHDTRFGLYCGLRVAELTQDIGAGNLFAEKISKLLKTAYNEVLRVETVQQIGVLDTFNNYDPPQCMIDKTMKNIMRHFLYQKYTHKMNKRLQDGSRGKRGSGSYGFYTALCKEEVIELKTKANNISK